MYIRRLSLNLTKAVRVESVVVGAIGFHEGKHMQRRRVSSVVIQKNIRTEALGIFFGFPLGCSLALPAAKKCDTACYIIVFQNRGEPPAHCQQVFRGFATETRERGRWLCSVFHLLCFSSICCLSVAWCGKKRAKCRPRITDGGARFLFVVSLFVGHSLVLPVGPCHHKCPHLMCVGVRVTLSDVR